MRPFTDTGKGREPAVYETGLSKENGLTRIGAVCLCGWWGRGMIEIELRLFNSLGRYGRSGPMQVPSSITVGEVLERLRVPAHKVYVSWLNGHNISTALGGAIEAHHELKQGDVLALSGPVPFSRSYGTPVC